jgi:hypothetical protein
LDDCSVLKHNLERGRANGDDGVRE